MISGFFAPMRNDAPPQFAAPMLRAHILNSVDPSDVKLAAQGVLTLADTGADACYIDVDLAAQCGLKQTTTLDNYTGQGTTKAPVFVGQIAIPKDEGGLSRLVLSFIGTRLGANGFRHRLLLGMDGLRFFDVTVSVKSSRFVLTWVGQ